MWPLEARIVFASVGLAAGLGGAGAIIRWGDPANALHVQAAGNCIWLAMICIASVIGVEIASIIKGAKA